MRKTCGEVVQQLCLRRGISQAVFPLLEKPLSCMGKTVSFVRSFYQTFTIVVHRQVYTISDDISTYTHYPHRLLHKKLLNKI